jgi:hypothetical protein
MFSAGLADYSPATRWGALLKEQVQGLASLTYCAASSSQNKYLVKQEVGQRLLVVNCQCLVQAVSCCGCRHAPREGPPPPRTHTHCQLLQSVSVSYTTTVHVITPANVWPGTEATAVQ